MERLLGFDAQLLFDSAFTAVNVLILFLVLSHYLLNPVRSFLQKRKDKIAGELQHAARESEFAHEMRKEYEDRLKGVGKEADQILEQAKVAAKRQEAEIIEEARSEADLMLKRAEKEIDLKKMQAMDEMRQEIVSIAAGMAVQILSGVLDSKVQKAVIDKMMEEMGEITWQA